MSDEPFDKRKHDEEKIKRFEAAGFPHQYDYEEWRPWTGNGYIKSHYDVLLPDGEVKLCLWPNAGLLTYGKIQFDADSGVKVRLSKNSPYLDTQP